MSSNKVIVSAFAALVVFGAVMPAKSQSTYFSETNKTVAKIGAEGNRFYASFAESVSQNCLYGILYISTDKKGLYVQLLAAKLANKHLSRVDYSQPGGSGTVCNVELVEIAE